MRSTTSIEIEAKRDPEGAVVGWDWQVRMPGHPTIFGEKPSWRSARRRARQELRSIVSKQQLADRRTAVSGLDLQG